MTHQAQFSTRPARTVNVLPTVTLILGVCLCLACDDRRQILRDIAALKRILELQAAEADFYARHARFGVLREIVAVDGKLADLSRARGILGGYHFEITVYATPTARYVLEARPLVWERDGYRSFYADQTGLVRATYRNEPATAESPTLAGSRGPEGDLIDRSPRARER